MNIYNDKRVVLTLDAGGSNLVFSAIQGGVEIVEQVCLPSNAHDLDLCLQTILKGFHSIQDQLNSNAIAISFAFPGPADYPNGIIGDLPNLPAFRGGVALGPMLEEEFSLPVYINNDGSLFVYGEAIAGLLPEVNKLLEKNGSGKRFSNLIGFTLGTGFGAGIVMNGKLLIGDNSLGGEAWLLRDMANSTTNIEESISIRAIKNAYAFKSGIPEGKLPGPKEIEQIARGDLEGNREAALEVYKNMGQALGEAMATVLTLVDGLIVLGGGISAAHPLFLEEARKQMNSSFTKTGGTHFSRLAMQVFNLESQSQLKQFLIGDSRTIEVAGTGKSMIYDPLARSGIGISRLGTSESVAIGAYAYALDRLAEKG